MLEWKIKMFYLNSFQFKIISVNILAVIVVVIIQKNEGSV